MNEIINKDCLTGLRELDSESVDCCITSPPYWGLRDYGVDGQLGLENIPEQYVDNIVEIFSEVKRTLKKEGTLWLNLGDSYYNYRGKNDFAIPQTISKHDGHKMNNACGKRNIKQDNLKGKDLVGIPWMVAFALRADGWYLRQDIIWNKPNPMPESVTDRCMKSHEYIFLLSKSPKYYYDQKSIMEETVTQDNNIRDRETTRLNNTPGRTRMNGLTQNNYEFRNKRSVWTVNTKPYSEAHFATFPQNLIKDCVKAGCPKGGIILDPFMGAGTTAVVARKLDRNYIGFELNNDYIKIANKRLLNEIGLYL